MKAAPAPSGPRALAGLLAEQFLAGKTGILSATRGKLKRLFCQEKGWLVFAASNVKEEQFGEHLVRLGLLSPASRAAATQEASQKKKTLAAILSEHNLVPADELRRAMEGQLRSLLSSCLEWPNGEFRFETGCPQLEGEVTVRLSPVQLILEHTKSHPASIDALRVRVGRPDLRPQRLPSSDPLLESQDLGEAGAYLLERSDGTQQLAELVPSSPAGEEATLRALYALLLLGVLRERAGDEAGPVAREEILTRLAKAESADHYTVLGLKRGASRDKIRDAYYVLARRLHPDRFRSGELQELLPKVEAYFSLVTESYNTLFDPDGRREYDARLDAEIQEAAAPAQGDKAHLARENFQRGKELLERKRYNEALTFFENAVKLDPTQAKYSLALGLLLSRNPRMRDEAERHLLRVVELEPTSTKAYVALGGLYRRAGQLDDAARMYREALRWEPGNVQAAAALKGIA